MGKPNIIFNTVSKNFILIYKILNFFGFKIFYINENKNLSSNQKKIINQFTNQIDISRIKSIKNDDWLEWDFGGKVISHEIIENKISNKFASGLSKYFNIDHKENKIYLFISQYFRQVIIEKSILLRTFISNKKNKSLLITFDLKDLFIFKHSKLKIILIPIKFEIFLKLIKKFLRFSTSFNNKMKLNSSMSNKNDLLKKKIVYILHHGLYYMSNRKNIIYDHLKKNENILREEEILFFDYTNSSISNEGVKIFNLKDVKLTKKQTLTLMFKITKIFIDIRNLNDFAIFINILPTIKSYYQFFLFLKMYKNLKIAYFDYDFLSPLNLLFAAKNAGLATMSYQERPSIVYYKNYYMNYDYYFCVSKYFLKKLENKENFIIKNKILSGFYNIDNNEDTPDQKKFFASNMNILNSKKIKILFILYPDEIFDDKISYHSSDRANKSILNEIINLSKIYPEIQFSIISKSKSFFKNKKFKRFINKIDSIENIFIFDDHFADFSLYMIKYHDLIIGKYSTIMDKCLLIEKPFLIHEYFHNFNKQISLADDHFDSFFLNNSNKELIEKINFYLNSKEQFFDKLIANKLKVLGKNQDAKFIIRNKIKSLII